MIDPATETVFLLSDGVRTPGVSKSYRSLYRYVTVGAQGCSRLVKLDHIRTPSGMATSVEAYWRFIRDLSRE